MAVKVSFRVTVGTREGTRTHDADSAVVENGNLLVTKKSGGTVVAGYAPNQWWWFEVEDREQVLPTNHSATPNTSPQ